MNKASTFQMSFSFPAVSLEVRSTDTSDLTWSRKMWPPSWLISTWWLLFCPPTFYCLPTHPPTRCAFHNTQFGTLEHVGSSLQQLCVCPSGVHWPTVQLLARFRNSNIWIIYKCDVLLVGHILWSGLVFASYLRWNLAPLPPFVCLPPPLNSIDQSRLVLQPPNHRSSKEALARLPR